MTNYYIISEYGVDTMVFNEMMIYEGWKYVSCRLINLAL